MHNFDLLTIRRLQLNKINGTTNKKQFKTFIQHQMLNEMVYETYFHVPEAGVLLVDCSGPVDELVSPEYAGNKNILVVHLL